MNCRPPHALICFLLVTMLAFQATSRAWTATIPFSSASATFDEGVPSTVASAIDGVISGNNGWSVSGGQFSPQTAVFRCATPVDASLLLVTLQHVSTNADHHLNEFRVSVTSDANPSLTGGNWTPLVPLEATSTATMLIVTNGYLLSLGSAATTIFRVAATAPFSGITGFRLEAFPFDFDAADGLAASLGHAVNGNMVLTEFQAEAEPLVNLALGKPVISSGATWGNLLVSYLTDGDPNTFSHPLADSGTLGYYFQVDLGREYRIARIVLRNRADGCCPERLTNYRVDLYTANGGVPGALNWSANIRTNGSNCGVAGMDVLGATNSASGTFAGRFVRIVNRSNAPYNPQIAEIEVYGAPAPIIRLFTADDDTLVSGQSTTLRWQIVNAVSASIAPGIGAVPPASGEMQVAPAATTTYTLTASNDAGAVTATMAVGLNVTLAPPQITEFLADNAGNLADEDGGSPDWIELKNPNPYRLDLGGYFLTDDATNLTKWMFPGARIPANGYRIVFASAKDRRDPQAELHTNFKLDAQGDYLALVDRDGTGILQQFPPDYPATNKFPRQKENISYGLGADGAAGFMRPPTPGAPNGATFAGVVADTAFSMDRGFYDTNIVLTITSTTPGAVIRYTTNGAEPTAASGFIFSGPMAISKTTVLRAAAFKPGWAPTDVDTQTYLFLSNVIASAVMSTGITHHAVYGRQMRDALREVPTLSLVTAGTINDTTEVKASLEWLGADGEPGFHAACGVNYYGGAFTVFAKKSFRLYFRSEYGTARLKFPVFAGHDHGLAAVDSFDQLELRNGSQDMVERGFYMANVFTDDTLLEMGHLNPHGRFVHLYLNGTYWGLFHLRERWGASMHQAYLGGAQENYESINGNWNVGGWADPGTVYDGDGSAWARVKSLRNNHAAVKPFLDVPEFVDYMLMWMCGGSEDEYRCVGPAGAGSGFKFYLNDADGWFCGPWYCAAGDRTARGAPGRSPGDGPGSLFSMLFAEGNPDYRVLLADRIYAALFNNGPLTSARNSARLTERCNQIQLAFLAEAARWGYLSPSNWAARRDYVLANWLPGRTAQALAEWRGAGFYPMLDAPTLNRQGGLVATNFQVAFVGPTDGTIYYTTNGDDPRLPGGGVAASAVGYASGGGISETLLPAGTRWRWFTDAIGLGPSDIVAGHPNWSAANWKHPDFSDAAWREGPAQLGYGEGDEATVIPFGNDPNNKWVSSYYRGRFTVTNIADLIGLTLRLKRDDGAIIYFNGVEAARSSMPAGVVSGTTAAVGATDDGQTFNVISLSPSLLRAGTNAVAVELHQTAPTTSDASFDLELLAVHPSTVGGAPPALTRNTVLKCRAKDGSQWSALNEAFFQVGPTVVDSGDVVVSELNFNPLGDDATEFIELMNLSSRAINLRGAWFTNGIQFAFPNNREVLMAPGQRLVLVKDLFAFQRLYGLDVPVFGAYSGSLDNAGESLTLATASSNVLTSFRYDHTPPWPAGADGGGYTLVLAHPDLGLTNAAAWRTSVAPNGTPGGSDASVFNGIAGLDADGDGLPAFVEYALGTSDTDPASGPGIVTAGFDLEGRFTITFSRHLRADDASISVEFSTDLMAWFPAALRSTRTSEPGVAIETWGAPAQGQSQLFLRLLIQRR